MGPIPAGAGETPGQITIAPTCRAYPRRRGGNSSPYRRCAYPAGLSPQARGNVDKEIGKIHNPGLSPQARGKPLTGDATTIAGRAYPRRRGGNWTVPVFVGMTSGPIPAGAGETRQRAILRRESGAYPRRRGGNIYGAPPIASVSGLSPQARGKLAWKCRLVVWQGPIPAGAGKRRAAEYDINACGPIPAGAGETDDADVISRVNRAYPRRRGGNSR